MVRIKRFSEKFPVKMRIDLGGRNAFMSQHFLYGTEVGAPFDQMCGERVPERVRGNGLCYLCLCGQLLDN